MQSKSPSEGPVAVNGLAENRLVEPEFEILRRSVRVVVLRDSTIPSEKHGVTLVRRDAPFGLFPVANADVIFSPGELSDLVFALEVVRAALERLARKPTGP